MQRPRQLTLLMVTCMMTSLTSIHCEEIRIGYLYSWYSTNHFMTQSMSLEGALISGAMTLARDAINNNSNLLAGHELTFIHDDTYSQELIGTRKTILQWRDGAIAFIGPEQSCDTEAIVASSLNLPMISYVSDVLQFIHACS